ncbi:MAG TPA: hypothetical protein VFM96_02575 [Gaiellaceae bacterium]|nr:hypothetical protein [Gaiellaceae bacterium]
MRLVVSEPAAELIKERGGRLYVRMKKARCCGAITTLVTSSSPPPGFEFERISEAGDIELFMPAHLERLPEELHVDVHRRRIEAYWNGCAWVA